MRFFFDEEKAAHAAAFIVKAKGGECDLMVLIKLLYLADRKSLIETGMPITGDRMVNMPHGPVLSRIYDEAKWSGDGREDTSWCRYLSERRGNTIKLESEPSFDELSEYEMDLLRSIVDQFGDRTAMSLRKMTHDLPEYHDPEGSSSEIDLTEILKSAGITDERIRQFSLDAEEAYFLSLIAGEGGRSREKSQQIA